MNKVLKKNITSLDLFKVFIASFFMQSVWNFRSLLSIGFSVCMLPVANKLFTDQKMKCALIKRHLKFFNAHPYFASYALGVSIRLEEDGQLGDPQMPDVLDRLKNLLISPLGALGDRLFWATIKPACLIFGILGIVAFQESAARMLVLIIAFLLYNIPHFYFRYIGILDGYKHGIEIYKYLNLKKFEKILKFYNIILLIGIFSFIILIIVRYMNLNPWLLIIFLATIVYARIMKIWFQNYYLVSLATFIFFLITGILFF